MNPVAFLVSTSLLIAGFYHTSHAEPLNIDKVRQTLIRYHDTGAYEKELQTTAKRIKAYLSSRIQKNKLSLKKQKLAVVFDIDETVLSNYKFMNKLRFGGTLQQFDNEVAKGQGTAIAPIRNLYYYALKQHIALFFITGRHVDKESSTIANLKKEGFNHWQGLYFKPNTYIKSKSTIPYKRDARKAISKQGYTIIASIGDQVSDYAGGYTEKGFKLPNPYYYIP